MFFLLFFTILTIFLVYVVFVKHRSTPYDTKKPPPSPPKLPIIGNLHKIGLHPHRSLQTLAQHYGPLMLLHFGNKPVLIVSSADSAKDIMKTHDLIFANRPKSVVIEKLLYNYKDVSMAPYGEYWRQMKSVCLVHLLSNKKVQSFVKVREEENTLLMEKIENAISSSSSSDINLSEVFSTLTNDVVCRVALGRKYSEGEGGRKFKRILKDFVECLGGFNIGDFIPWLSWVSRVNGFDAKVDKVAKEFDDFLDGIVEEHINRQKVNDRGDRFQVDDEFHNNKDFVDVLLWIQRENVLGFPIDRVSIKALILDMFAAGTDTTYTVLEWAMTELLRHPNVMKQLQNEIRKIAGDKPRITEDELDEMTYLKSVIKETLRLHPPIPLLVPRETTQDIKIKGCDIAAGTQVIVNAWAIGRDNESWENPNEFNPDRFMNNSIDFKGHDFELIPFGAGRRGCPGIQFAMAINELVLANILHKFDWRFVDGGKEEDLNMIESSGLTIHRKFPLVVVPTRWC